MKRLMLSQVLARRDAGHRSQLKATMRSKLRHEAQKKGLKPGPIIFSEHYEEIDGGMFTLLVIDARMDAE